MGQVWVGMVEFLLSFVRLVSEIGEEGGVVMLAFHSWPCSLMPQCAQEGGERSREKGSWCMHWHPLLHIELHTELVNPGAC